MARNYRRDTHAVPADHRTVHYRRRLMSEGSEDINRRLLRARDAMDRRYAEPLDVDQLAQVAHMARSHFIREFQRVFAETPHRYLQRRRVERAMFLLRHTSATATDICMAVGYTSFGTFSRTFTAIVGQPPSVYRDAPTTQRGPAPTSFTMRWTRPATFPTTPPGEEGSSTRS